MEALNGQVHVQLPTDMLYGCSINGCQAFNSSGQSPSSAGPSGIVNQTSLHRVKKDTSSILSSVNSTSAVAVESVCQADDVLSLALIDSVLRDSQGRTGYLASDRQFQFDAPPQSGALVTAGFSICNNGSLALGRFTTWWACSSGAFSKIYDQDWAAQCTAIQLKTVQVVDCNVDPSIVTAGTLGPNATAFLASLANTPVNLPSRTWALPTDLGFSTSAATNTLGSSNLTLSNSTLVTGNSIVATPFPNLPFPNLGPGPVVLSSKSDT
ncbi:MAG: hypothetical protein GOMPHAMPRED_000254 [Gomphillus americanus]|uniref:Cell wall mannoprotein PIR1-like C-terminal domain-containing protein n=1 Tax=Gomphillus americanus TaxID=1940652 RepID=A0A8H3EE05_9LECA|nr:MAG: hypothetical protein GOMPHAMPRED_000254 [Gomphillus americanus]